MSKNYITAILIFSAAIASLSTGCANRENPRGVVLSFIKAVKGSDTTEIEKDLSFERLMIERDGEKYLKMAPDERAKAVAGLRDNILHQLATGNLKYFGKIDPGIRSERISGDKAEVIVYDKGKKDVTYSFGLAREQNGAWKIFRISAL